MNNTNNSENNGVTQNTVDDKDIIIIIKQLTDKDKVELVEYLNNKNSAVIYCSESKYKNEIQELLIQHNQLNNHNLYDCRNIKQHLEDKSASLKAFKQLLSPTKSKGKCFDSGVLCNIVLFDNKNKDSSFKELPLYQANTLKEDYDEWDKEEEIYIADGFSLIKLESFGTAQPRQPVGGDIMPIQTNVVGFKLKQ